MKLEIRVFADLRKKIDAVITADPGEAFLLDMPEGATLGEVIKKLGISADYPLIGLVNGLREMETSQLKDGDRIGIFPPVGGG